MIKNLLILTITLAIAGHAAAQSPKAAEQQKSKPAARVESAPSNVDGKFTILSSHMKSIGTIGKTGRYEIISTRLRGLDSPNISALLAYDSVTDTLGVLASGVEPGLGVAIVNGAATVGGNFLFGASLRPDRTSVSNNSESEGSSAKSTSEGGDGGTAVSVSEGGDAVSVSDADAKSSSTSAAVAVSSSSVKNHNSVHNSNSNTSINSNVNANSNQQSQGQGQLQGQQQGQGQAQGQSNNNHNHNKAPKKSKKSNKH